MALSALFYQEKYEQVLEQLRAVKEPTISDLHNIALCECILEGRNPYSTLLQLIEKVRAECDPTQKYPVHPSWALLHYHLGLYHFQRCQFSDCEKILNFLWSHFDLIDDITLIFMSLLTYELAIRADIWTDVDKATKYFQDKFTKIDNAAAFIKKFFDKSPQRDIIVDQIKYATLRIRVAKLIKSGDDEAKSKLVTTLNSMPKQIQSTYQAYPLLSASLYLQDSNHFEKVLNSCPKPYDFSILNNLGVYEMLQKKYSSALLHFSKSLQTRKTTDVIHPFQQVLYNIGISLLQKQKPRKAFNVLYSIIGAIPHYPYLWLRLAECCVLYYKQRVAKLRSKTQLSAVIARRLSTPTRSFTILPCSNAQLFNRHMKRGGSSATPSLEFAELCAEKAAALANGEGLQWLEHRAHLVQAYVCLELGEWERAAALSRDFVASGEGALKFTARVYCAQALCQLRDFAGAFEILKPLILEVSFNQDKNQVAMYHLTCAQLHIADQKPEGAAQPLQKIMEQAAGCPEVVLTRAALEMKRGGPKDALRILNEYVTPPDE